MRMLPVTKSAVPLTDVHHTNLLMLAQVKESRVGSVVSFKRNGSQITSGYHIAWDAYCFAEILKKPNTLKMCSHKWDKDYSSLLSTFNLRPSQLVARFQNYVFSIKSLTTSSTSFQYFHLQTSAKLCFLSFSSSHLYNSFFSFICLTKLICLFCSLSVEFTS